MKISQVSVSQTATYFKTGLKERWGLSDYSDPNAPCLFFGVSDQVDLINKHKGYKLLYFIDKYDTYPANISSHNVICFANPYSSPSISILKIVSLGFRICFKTDSILI